MDHVRCLLIEIQITSSFSNPISPSEACGSSLVWPLGISWDCFSEYVSLDWKWPLLHNCILWVPVTLPSSCDCIIPWGSSVLTQSFVSSILTLAYYNVKYYLFLGGTLTDTSYFTPQYSDKQNEPKSLCEFIPIHLYFNITVITNLLTHQDE